MRRATASINGFTKRISQDEVENILIKVLQKKHGKCNASMAIQEVILEHNMKYVDIIPAIWRLAEKRKLTVEPNDVLVLSYKTLIVG